MPYAIDPPREAVLDRKNDSHTENLIKSTSNGKSTEPAHPAAGSVALTELSRCREETPSAAHRRPVLV
ncbi:MAG TPA: hypothetical protein PK729_13920 [Candidatus Hydrogenedentes bacterium]|nr:hypothetical protein [Candidatus Hydrogenedentota bacterium]